MPKQTIDETSPEFLAGKAAGLNWAVSFCQGLAKGEQAWANISTVRPATHEYAALQLSHAASHINAALSHVLAEAETERQRDEARWMEGAATTARERAAREAESRRKGPARRNRPLKDG